MKDPQEHCAGDRSALAGETAATSPTHNPNKQPADSSRRSFLGKVGMGSAAAVALAAVPLAPLVEGKHAEADASVISYSERGRAGVSFNYRVSTAQAEEVNPGVLPDNGDFERFSDYSGSWSKVLPHTALGIVSPTAYQTFIHALTTGRFSDFEHIIIGNPGGSASTSTFNGPQGSLAFDLEGLDSHATVIPPAPSMASAQTAAEQVEHYWAALMRDVQFSQYPTSSIAAQACADLNNLSYIRSNQNNEYPFPITPQNLFRGQAFTGDGNVQGPYIAQFFVQPTTMGVQALTQQFQRFLSVSEGGSDFMTTPSEYLNVESGGIPTGVLQFDPTARYLRMGRDFAAYTHVDVLYQEFFVAMLVLSQIGCPPNPGNPYNGSRTEHGFGTFGGPDIAGTMAEMATRALKASWFHKWIVNLCPRPEEYGALVQANLTHQRPMPQAAAALSHDVFNSAVLPIIFSQYNSYLLPQAFPEGAPGHPCYPTGHGTVAGACITALKFFFDCSQRIQPLLQAAGRDVYVPSTDGLSLETYGGSDAGSLTVNGELSKLAFNTSFGHGIHAGIHFRSSTLYSILLGEEVALSILQDRANSYNEPFTISITKFNGTAVTITNEG